MLDYSSKWRFDSSLGYPWNTPACFSIQRRTCSVHFRWWHEPKTLDLHSRQDCERPANGPPHAYQDVGIHCFLKLKHLSFSFHGHEDVVRCISYLPERDLYITGSWDGTLRLWSPSSKQTSETIKPQTTRKTSTVKTESEITCSFIEPNFLNAVRQRLFSLRFYSHAWLFRTILNCGRLLHWWRSMRINIQRSGMEMSHSLLQILLKVKDRCSLTSYWTMLRSEDWTRSSTNLNPKHQRTHSRKHQHF